ncbi:YncE family protein [Polaribacter sp. IC073]|uniref:YncE family protein n=1 Tax=Polaribacter sp. IC073 TaxID=2508540 RepID=UPI0011BE9222|nr:DUF5074 domain-containing protein [Polaribacter sp. IC073]TXD46883.1 hypothetical protein ES045_13000 [Polaribacter sp. IC073]
MKNHFLKTLLFLISITLFLSCEKNELDEAYIAKGAYDLGFIVSNEGNFGSPNASISFISADLSTTINEVYSKENNAPVGDILQSITFDDNYAYLILNNSNKVEVVDKYTFKRITTLTQEDIELPRYADTKDGKLYITNARSKSVVIYNIADFSYETTIDIGRAVEQIIVEDDFMYIQNAAYGSGNNITVVDLKTNTVIKTLVTGKGLNSMEEEDGVLYAMHNTGITKIDISTNEVIGEITLRGSLEKPSKLDIEDSNIYFISGSSIYSSPITSTELSDIPLVNSEVVAESWFTGYGFAVENNRIFYADVKGFSENSVVLVYDLEGKFLKSINTGIGTNNIYFND